MRTFWLAALLLITAQTFAFAQPDEADEARFVRRIIAFWQDGDDAIVEAEITQFFVQYPQSPYRDSMQILLGDMQWKQHHYERALIHYAAVQDADLCQKIHLKQLDCLYRLQLYESLVKEAKLVEQLNSPEDALEAFYYAEALFYNQRIGEAADWYRKLLGTSHEVNALLALSTIHNTIGAYSEAAEMQLLLAEKLPERRKEMLERASKTAFAKTLLLFEWGDYESFLKESSSLSLAGIDLYRGQAYAELGRYEEAQAALLPLLEEKIEPAVLLTLILSACELNQTERAEKWAEQFEKEFPQTSSLAKVLQALAQLKTRQKQFQEAAALFVRLSEEFDAESPLALAQEFEQKGELEMALALYSRQNSPAAQLLGTRLAFARIPPEKHTVTHPETLALLKALKDLQMRRQFQNEPLHLEAAIDYAAFRSSLEPPEKQYEQQLQLLLRFKEELTSQEGLWAKDYHATRLKTPEKADLYQAYLMLIDAHIFRLESRLKRRERQIKEEAAAELYKNLLQGKFAVSKYVVDQAQSGLEQLKPELTPER